MGDEVVWGFYELGSVENGVVALLLSSFLGILWLVVADKAEL